MKTLAVISFSIILVIVSISVWTPYGGATYAPTVHSVTVSSSSVGTELFQGFERGVYLNATGAVCIARLETCSELTSCIGLPLAADTGVALSRGTDSSGRHCAILKSGSTPVTIGVNLFGSD